MTDTIEHDVRNGVDTTTLFATLDAVRATPDLAQFRFRATNTWRGGTHSNSAIEWFHGTGQDLAHTQRFQLDADHPQVLVGNDHGPTPAEYLLHALAACLTAGLANIAAARKVNLDTVSCTVTGDIDLRGILGLDPAVRNGFQNIAVAFELAGDDPAKLSDVVERSKARSAVYDMLTNGVPIEISVNAG